MNKIAIHEVRPWEQPFWRPAPGKRVVLLYLLLIQIPAVVGLILFLLPSMRILGLALLFTALGGFGTTISYHRMLAHRTLNAKQDHRAPAYFGGHVRLLPMCRAFEDEPGKSRPPSSSPPALVRCERINSFAKRKSEFLC